MNSQIIYSVETTILLRIVEKRYHADCQHLTREKIVAAALLVCLRDDDRYRSFFAQELGNDRSVAFLTEELPIVYRYFGEDRNYLFDCLSRLEEYIADHPEDPSYYALEQKAFEEGKKNDWITLHISSLLENLFREPTPFLESLKKPVNEEEAVREETEAVEEDDELADEMLSTQELLNASDDPKIRSNKNSFRALVKKTISLRRKLQKLMSGQENAIQTFVTGFYHAGTLKLMGVQNSHPAAVYLFAGPPGVGKTFFSETVAGYLDLPFCRFDMSEYADKEAHMTFIGSNQVYRGSAEGTLTGFVKKHEDGAVVLLDEIEKAHPVIIRLLLQLLDAGRLRDVFLDEEIDFSKVIIIMTTNAGKQLYENHPSGNFSMIPPNVVLDAIVKEKNPLTNAPFFPAAISSRLSAGNVVMFNRLSVAALKAIARNEYLGYVQSYRKMGLDVQIDKYLYAALLFSKGKNVDARNIKGGAGSFLSSSLYDLSRLLESNQPGPTINDIDTVRIHLAIPEDDPPIKELFVSPNPFEVMVVADSPVMQAIQNEAANCRFYQVTTPEEASEVLSRHDISLAMVDPLMGTDADTRELMSSSVSLLHRIAEDYPAIPVYVVQSRKRMYNNEERASFVKEGVRDFLTLDDPRQPFSARLSEICEDIHCENQIIRLGSSCKVLTYKTCELLTDPKTAEIRLFDFKLVTAMEAEDTDSVVSELSRPDITFHDVIGAEDAKKELRFFIDYLKDPRKYAGSGLHSPKGVLLYGPPGTGKTMLAKAMAGEANVTFLSSEGNRFVRKYVGEGAEELHKLFATARKYAPSIIFIDEIDSIGADRNSSSEKNSSADVLTAMLTEMDGFHNDISRPVFVLAATNYSVDRGTKILDPALTRRFDRTIFVDLPKKSDRLNYLNLKLSDPVFEVTDPMRQNLAQRSIGMSLAQLEQVIELSLRMAVREGKMKVTDSILDESLELFCNGEKKKWNEASMRRVAVHESGHLLMNLLGGGRPAYVTITSRGDFGGYVMEEPAEDSINLTKNDILKHIRCALGGRAAELVYYGEKEGLSTGPSSDFRKAFHFCLQMICTYGMSENLGIISTNSIMPESVREQIYAECSAVLKREMDFAVEMIGKHRELLEAFIEKLLNCSHMTQSEIQEIYLQFQD